MTIHEASERYNIPLEILRDYESWGLCGAVKEVMGSWQYDDTDLERLSLIMTLHDAGFESRKLKPICACCWSRRAQKASVSGCSLRNGSICWMRFISGRLSWRVWIICVTTSADSRPARRMSNKPARQYFSQ